MFVDPDGDPATAALSRKYPNLVPLPRPGGPVDIGIDQAAQAARGITPLPRPNYTYPHVLSMGGDRQLMGGGGGGGAWVTDPWAKPVLSPEIMDYALKMYQVRKSASPPGQSRMAAVAAAQQKAAEHLKRIQHKRRANGPYR